MDRNQESSRRASESGEPVARQPAETIRDGNLKASIWRNEGPSGAYYATTFSRSYRDESGAYRDSNSFVAADLLKLSELARTAYTRTNAMRREDRAQAKEAAPEREAFRARREESAPRRTPEPRR